MSNSCDNDAGDPIEFAPVHAYGYADGVETDADRWRDISEAATGTASPKFFYLPGSKALGLDRSEAFLGDRFTLDPSYVELCIQGRGMRRICGLSPSATRHLQWQVSMVYGRDPREDDEWPSDADLRLKLAWLEQEIDRGSNRYARYVEERAELQRRLGLDDTGAKPAPAAAATAHVETPEPEDRAPSDPTGDMDK